MTHVLRDLVAHMRWADSLVADALEGDTSPEPDAARLFAHIASVEHLWYSRIQGVAPAHAVWPALSVAEARALAAEHGELFARLVRDANAAALARVASYRNSAGREFTNTVEEIVTHVAMHGSHHRGQIALRVRASGQEPPYVDYIQFMRRNQ